MQVISSLQPFWNALDAVDSAVLVLDPANPSRKHQSRRIILGKIIVISVSFFGNKGDFSEIWGLSVYRAAEVMHSQR